MNVLEQEIDEQEIEQDDLFNVDELVQKKPKKRKPLKCNHCEKEIIFETPSDKKAWQNNNAICPFCQTIYCDKPPTEVELMNLQSVYLDNRIIEQELIDNKGKPEYHILVNKKRESDRALFKLCEIVKSYSEALLHKRFKAATYDRDEMETYMEGIALLMLETYLSRPDFKVDGSFWGYLFKIAQGVVYQRKQMPLEKQAQLKGISLVSIDQEYKSQDSESSQVQIADINADAYTDKRIELYEGILLYQKLIELLKLACEKIGNPYIELMVLVSVKNLIQTGGKSTILASVFDDVNVGKYTRSIMNSIRDLIESYTDPNVLWQIKTTIDQKQFGWIESDEAEKLCKQYLGDDYFSKVEFDKLKFPILDTEIRDLCLAVIENEKKSKKVFVEYDEPDC